MTTTTTQNCGTLAEFLRDRNSRRANREQMEAFAVEFYCMVVQIVKCRENRFTLASDLSFPGMDAESADVMVEFLGWSLSYLTWVGNLYSFERDTLATARVIWE